MVMALALGRKTLSFHSALTAAMTTVECFAALAMTLSQKESLAARFFIFTTSLVSLICLAATFVFMSSIHEYEQGTECCARVIWWGVIDCEGVSPTFWLYLSYRGLCWVCNTLTCLMLTGPFDKAGKKDYETHATTDSDNDHDFERGKYEKTKDLRREYTDMPATVDLHYLDWVLDCLSSITSLEIMLRRFGLPKDEGLDKWGQAVQMVLCIAGILHLCFNVCKHCKHGWQRPKLLHAIWELHHVSFWWNYEEIVREIGLEWRLPAAEGGGLLSRFKARTTTMLQHTLGGGNPTSAAHHSKHKKSEVDEDDGKEQSQGATGTSTGVSGADQAQQGLHRRRTQPGQLATKDKSFDLELINAAIGGSEESIRYLLKNANVNARDEYGETALMVVASSRLHEAPVQVIKLLLENGAAVNATNMDGETALMKAADSGMLESVRLLLENGAGTEVSGGFQLGITALMVAASHCSEDKVKLLLENGACVKAKDWWGETALMKAARLPGALNTVKLLLENGADIGAMDEDGGTALMEAASHGHKEVAALLIANDADSPSDDEGIERALERAESHEKRYQETVQLLREEHTRREVHLKERRRRERQRFIRSYRRCSSSSDSGDSLS